MRRLNREALKKASSYCLSGSEGPPLSDSCTLRVSSKASQLLQSSPPVWKKQVDGTEPAVRADCSWEVPCASTGRELGRISVCSTVPWMRGRKGGTPGIEKGDVATPKADGYL